MNLSIIIKGDLMSQDAEKIIKEINDDYPNERAEPCEDRSQDKINKIESLIRSLDQEQLNEFAIKNNAVDRFMEDFYEYQLTIDDDETSFDDFIRELILIKTRTNQNRL